MRLRARFILIGVALLAIVIMMSTPHKPRTFALHQASGGVLTNRDLLGHPYLVYFGYTHCPDLCPTTLAQLSDILAQMPGAPIRVLFVTLDPERDNAQIMGDYVANFDKRIVGLSGSRREIDQISRIFRVKVTKIVGKDAGYMLNHSSFVYLVDRFGNFSRILPLDRPVSELVRLLRSYL